MENHFKNRLFVVFFIILQSCNTFPKINTNCGKINKIVSERYSLFKKLDQSEIIKRSNISVPTYSKLEELSVFTKIVQSVKNSKKNTKLITVDLRNYKSVNLGNIVISNTPSDLSLNLFLKTSKYSQGFFALINFGKDKITLLSPTLTPNNGGEYFKKQIINRSDLQDTELVFNVRDSREIFANMKFNEKQKISLLARNIKKPFRLDLREASNNQYNLGQKWIMSVYDISNSEIDGGKKTSGYYLYVNNNDVRDIKLHKFNKSKVACYSNPGGLRLEESIDTSLN
jgi:hypothetical protein